MALHGEFNLNGNQRAELRAHMRRHNLPASVAQRMRIVLMLADGARYSEIQETLETAATTISRWKKRYEQDGLEGLATFHPGQPPRLLRPALRAKILSKLQQSPPDGSTHWTLRKMAKVLKVGKDLIRKVWKELDLRPHRLDRYKASDDPEFEPKQPRSSDSTCTRRSTPPCFAWMRRPRFGLWIARTVACPYHRDEPNGTDSNTCAMERCPCTRR